MLAECSEMLAEFSEMLVECSEMFVECSEMLAEFSEMLAECSEMLAECSEMLAIKVHTPENIPKENIRHSKHGESLKSKVARSSHCILFGICRLAGCAVVFCHYFANGTFFILVNTNFT
jgi:hypothetical protein